MRRTLTTSVLTVILLASTPAVAAEVFVMGEGVVADGDSFRVDEQVIRLYAIDAPELAQMCPTAGGRTWRCGEEARQRLAAILALGPVICVGEEYDQFGRLIAECDDWNGVPINAALVREGYAWAFTRYDDLYVAEEKLAREEGLGIWQAPTQPAWDWRAERGGGRTR